MSSEGFFSSRSKLAILLVDQKTYVMAQERQHNGNGNIVLMDGIRPQHDCWFEDKRKSFQRFWTVAIVVFE